MPKFTIHIYTIRFRDRPYLARGLRRLNAFRVVGCWYSRNLTRSYSTPGLAVSVGVA